jgi:hypothetical protein
MADILAFLFFFGAVAFLVTAIVFLVEKKFKKALMMLGLMLVSLILFIIAVMFTDIGTEATTEVVEPETVELTATVETATFNKKKYGLCTTSRSHTWAIIIVKSAFSKQYSP